MERFNPELTQELRTLYFKEILSNCFVARYSNYPEANAEALVKLEGIANLDPLLGMQARMISSLEEKDFKHLYEMTFLKPLDNI